ncbi:MAG TPA: hypothetical protein VJP89_05315 [Pyrinomonadaceae bacterium]|nr:hypothetical protein [Pyrinomonadaceae bacterium]
MELVRDCLDKQLDDSGKRRMGRVDGIILVLEPDRAPRVAYIEVGVTTLMNRLSVHVGRKLSRWMRNRGISPDPFRIPWVKLKIGLNQVIADVEAEKSPALEWELWLRKRVIGRIPGAK